MEIPEIHMITDFGDGVKLLQTPVSSGGSLFLISQVQRWWKVGALILAICAAFRSVLRRSRLVLILSRTFRSPPSRRVEAFDSGEDDGDDSVSDSSEDEQEAADREIKTTSHSHVGQRFFGEDFGAKLWNRNSLPRLRGGLAESNLGRNVVKLWDSFGLRLDFDEDLFNSDSKSVVSTWDSDEDEKTIDYWNIPAASSSLILTAEGNEKGDGVILSGYDSRIRRRSPALYAEWSSPTQKVSGLSAGGVSKVYVRDDVNGVIRVGDVRKVGRPLKTMRKRNGDTWWDSDTVLLD